MESIVLFGGKGFVGTHIYKMFKKKFNVLQFGREVDIRNAENILDVLSSIRADYIINLASFTTLREAQASINDAEDLMFNGQKNLLECLDILNFTGSCLYVSSGEVYGDAELDSFGHRESDLVKPNSNYALLKHRAENLTLTHSKKSFYKLNVARPFNHIGPGQSERFAVANFTKQVAEIKLKMRQPIISVGDLHVKRDFLDVRDVVEQYLSILKSELNGEVFNICSGEAIEIRLVLKKLLKIAKIQADLEVDPKLVRAGQKAISKGNNNKIISLFGDRELIPLEKSLSDSINFWTRHLINNIK